MKEFVPDKETKAKLISKGHMNVQNYADMKHAEKVEPGKFYDLEFELQPTFYFWFLNQLRQQKFVL